jgi:hypothetical protein
LLAVVPSLGASYRSTNFVVEAPTPQVAQQVAQYAETYRKEKAMQWLGQEMPAWGQPCPLKVTVTMNGASGATTFAFDRGQILHQDMHIEGSQERLLNSVLPHEITHTVFAYHFRQPVPRWADEGGSVLSEDDIERGRHDQLCRQILNTPGRAIPLRRLFSLKDYPGDVMCLYAEGFSVSDYLVGISDRPTFLNFVAQGMQEGWDAAAQTQYRFKSVDDLEGAWLTHLKETKKDKAILAQNPKTDQPDKDRLVVRQTVPPAQPLADGPAKPTFRGSAPDDAADQVVGRNGRPTRLPDSDPGRPSGPAPQPAAQDRWQSPAAPPSPPGVVLLGPPEYPPQPPAPSGRPAPGPSPVGYPR